METEIPKWLVFAIALVFFALAGLGLWWENRKGR